MMKTMHEKLFDDRIASRLKSDEWDLGIAGAVNRRRRSRKIGFAAAGTISSLALAAMLAIAVLPGLWGGAGAGGDLNYFVNAQVAGTWNTVFTGAGQAVESDASVVDPGYEDDIDTFIDDTLAMRL